MMFLQYGIWSIFGVFLGRCNTLIEPVKSAGMEQNRYLYHQDSAIFMMDRRLRSLSVNPAQTDETDVRPYDISFRHSIDLPPAVQP